MDVRGTKVFLGLSGGVDSAVSAALLARAGAQVTGVFIKGWYPPGMPCTWAAERRDAMRVAARLHIPFLTLDASKEYKKSVIDYLISEYRAGRTPNPDVLCNREVKFGAFHRFAKARGADAIAMGHYRSGEKDQSYFLWAVPKEILAETIFPVGALSKDRVRMLAREFNLPVAAKKDSQGVCFLGAISVEEFLTNEFGIHPGRAVDEEGKDVGTHNGALLYTLGERVPIHDVVGAKPGTLGEVWRGPWYVLAKDSARNELVVGKARVPAPERLRPNLTFERENWLGDPARTTEAQYRYRGPRIRGRITGNRFECSEPLPEIPAPGQSIVFYGGGELIGGGVLAGHSAGGRIE